MTDKKDRKALMYNDLSDDGDRRQRRLLYAVSTRQDSAVDLIMQWKRFLSQEHYSEEPITVINQEGLRLLLDAALEAPLRIKNAADAEIAERLTRNVQSFVYQQFKELNHGQTAPAVAMTHCLYRGRMTNHFEIDLKVFLVDETKYVTIDAVSVLLNQLLEPESGCVHDVGFGNMGITFWQSFELPFLKWAI